MKLFESWLFPADEVSHHQCAGHNLDVVSGSEEQLNCRSGTTPPNTPLQGLIYIRPPSVVVPHPTCALSPLLSLLIGTWGSGEAPLVPQTAAQFTFKPFAFIY